MDVNCRIKTSGIIRWIWTLLRVIVMRSQDYVFPLMREVWQRVNNSFFLQLLWYILCYLRGVVDVLCGWEVCVGTFCLEDSSIVSNVSNMEEPRKMNGWTFNSVEILSYGVEKIRFWECCLSDLVLLEIVMSVWWYLPFFFISKFQWV